MFHPPHRDRAVGVRRAGLAQLRAAHGCGAPRPRGAARAPSSPTAAIHLDFRPRMRGKCVPPHRGASSVEGRRRGDQEDGLDPLSQRDAGRVTCSAKPMGRQWSPRVTSLPRISTSSYLESKRRLSRDYSSVITTVAIAPATPPRKLVCSIGRACQGSCAGTTAPTNAAIADLPRVEVAWRNPGGPVARVMSSLVKPLFRWYRTVRGW
jgi:hypothetical protein